MDADDSGSLTNSQMDMVLQLQDFTGLEDMNVCRDVLQRHNWDLEVAIQEQLNIKEGRPSVYATESRPPTVINDRFTQQVFTSADRTVSTTHSNNNNSDEGGGGRNGLFGMVRYLFNYVFNLCYNTISTNLAFVMSLFRNGQERIVTDPLGDVLSFIQSYKDKYPVHPVFYQGTYAQALNDAKRELKFLLVYLHSERQNSTDVASMCRNCLANDKVIEYINRNMLFWACDIESPEGYRVSHSINARSYPIMVMLSMRDNKMTIVGRLEGDCSPQDLLHRLRMVVSQNEVWLSQARAERLERSFTQSLRQQQDEAYEQSLRADQEKERRRQLELEEQRRAEEAIAMERRAEEEQKEQIARLKVELLSQVPAEPAATDPDTLLFQFKLPSGARPERRFRPTDTVRTVYNFIFCHPGSPDHFEVTTNFPKRVLYSDAKETNISAESTIAEVGLQNREVLFINDLDA